MDGRAFERGPAAAELQAALREGSSPGSPATGVLVALRRRGRRTKPDRRARRSGPRTASRRRPRCCALLPVAGHRSREPHVVGRLHPDADGVRVPELRWSAQTPSTITMPVGSIVRVPRSTRAVQSYEANVAASPRASGRTTSRSRRSRSNPSPSQNSSVETTQASGTIRASVVFPAAPCPPIPTSVRPSSWCVAAMRSSTGRDPSQHGTLSCMDKLRLGGMALSNGVLVHGPTCWGAAIRASDGSIRAASGVKRRFAPNVTTPFIRGPLRLAEAFAVLPDVRRALPEARFPFERPRVAVAVVGGALAAGIARRSQIGFLGKEADCGICIARPCRDRAPGRRARLVSRSRAHLDRHLRDGQAGNQGARSLRRPSRRPVAADERRRERARGPRACVDPPGGKSARRRWCDGSRRRDLRVDGPASRAAALAGARATRPILQTRISTAEPSAEQLEVAEAALTACLEAEEPA